MPLQQLRDFAELLIEIHGQQEFQHLVKRSAQRQMLDEHLGDPALLQAVADAYTAARTCRDEYESLQAAAANRESRLDLLRYQLTELQAEVGTVSAIEELFVEQKRISGRGRLSAAAQTAFTGDLRCRRRQRSRSAGQGVGHPALAGRYRPEACPPRAASRGGHDPDP